MHRIDGTFRVSVKPFSDEFLAHTTSMNSEFANNGLKRLSIIHPPSMHYTLLAQDSPDDEDRTRCTMGQGTGDAAQIELLLRGSASIPSHDEVHSQVRGELDNLLARIAHQHHFVVALRVGREREDVDDRDFVLGRGAGLPDEEASGPEAGFGAVGRDDISHWSVPFSATVETARPAWVASKIWPGS